MQKILINRAFKKKISAVIKLVRELLISSMYNKFEQDKRKTFHVVAHPQGQIIDVKCEN